MISLQPPWPILAQQQLLQMLGGHIEFPELDFRLKYLLDNFNCEDLTAVEFGCWHGWHTVPLARKFRHVSAIDVRPDNIAKTLLRLHLLGIKNTDVILGNVEDLHYKADVLVHIGVLYHLFNPVAHLHRVLPNCSILCLDTHINKPELTPTIEIYGGISYSGGLYREHGWKDPLSGVNDTSVWLDEDVLTSILIRHGFEIVHEKRHVVSAGPRLNIVAVRNPILYV